MLTAQIEPWVRVTAYLVVVGLSLEVAHRVYHRLHVWSAKLDTNVVAKSALMAFSSCVPLVATCLVTSVFCLYVDSQSAAAMGIRFDGRPGASVGAGAVIAISSVTGIFLIGYLSGWFRVEDSRLSSGFCKSFPVLCGGATDFVTSSAFEELIMRGYVFWILYQSQGASAAIIGSAAVFSLFHLVKHAKLPVLFTLNAFLFGVLTAQSRHITGALWLPLGLHIGWNIAAATIFGLPFAGRTYKGGLITCRVDGPEYITGGYYSPDAGLLGTVGLLFASLGFLLLRPFL